MQNPYKAPKTNDATDELDGAILADAVDRVSVTGSIAYDDWQDIRKLSAQGSSVDFSLVFLYAPVGVLLLYLTAVAKMGFTHNAFLDTGREMAIAFVVTIILAWFGYSGRKKARLESNSQTGVYAIRTYELSPESIRIHTESMDARHDWSEVSHYTAKGDKVLLTLKGPGGAFFFFPRRWFDSDTDWATFIAFVKAKLPDKAPSP